MSETISEITQMCIVVEDVEMASAHWATVLGKEQAVIETIFPEGIDHVTYGKEAVYKDCRVAKYQMQNIVLELMEPGKGPSPWRDFLEKNGQGVFHVCLNVENPEDVYSRFSSFGVNEPYHVGNFHFGSYSYMASEQALGIEVSVNHIDQTYKS